MKRIIPLILALCLMVPVFVLGEEEDYHMSILDVNFDGWYPRSTGGAELAVVDGSIKITGRTQDWNSPGRDFKLVPGRAYEVEVEVYQDEADTATIILSAAHTKDGRETYTNIVRHDVKKGAWTTLSAEYIAGDFDAFVLYVETLGAPNLSYQIKNFKALSKRAVIDAQLPSLKEVYADYFD
ncbi:MAG TPA: hypothetical protein GX006_02610, partial [Clostridiales bacterium]|nr:hypothetical protein [Clostridiales bacterium]